MPNQHLSSQFNHELNQVSSHVLELGGLAEMQIRQAMRALAAFNVEVAEQVEQTEHSLNALELDIDRELSSIIARRQPTAIDLRLLLAISKTTTNLERVGDEAAKIARMVKRIIESDNGRVLPAGELRIASDLAAQQLRRALDAFARLSAEDAVAIIHDDDELDREFDGFVRKLITYMMEDPRTISASLDLLTLAKAIERIGDHAKNIAEFVIYIVKGDDVRHRSLERVERVDQQEPAPR
jgi:phosphate transport system protein